MIDPTAILSDPTFQQYLAQLEAALQDTHQLGVQAGYEGMATQTSMAPAFSLLNPATSAAVDTLGTRIVGISDTTRSMVQDVIQAGIDNGSTIDEMAAALASSGAFSESRALTIARTESRTAYNLGGAAAMRDLGASQVYIEDGEDFDEACAEVDGTIQDIDWFEENPLEHPSCTRTAAPVPADEEEA